MLPEEKNQTTEPFFHQIHGVTAYRGVDETLIQVFTPVHQAGGGEAGRFIRIADSDGSERLGRAVLTALDLAGNPHDRGEGQGWLLLRKSKPDVMTLWRKLVEKAAICLVERSAFSITIMPTRKLNAFPSFKPSDKAAIQLPLDADPAVVGEQLLQAFERCE
jgi:hypothetical protein